MSKILTPDELERESAISVDRAVNRINADMAEGHRAFWILKGISPRVAWMIRDSGWNVDVLEGEGFQDKDRLTISKAAS